MKIPKLSKHRRNASAEADFAHPEHLRAHSNLGLQAGNSSRTGGPPPRGPTQLGPSLQHNSPYDPIPHNLHISMPPSHASPSDPAAAEEEANVEAAKRVSLQVCVCDDCECVRVQRKIV
jgi:hypothetical protein